MEWCLEGSIIEGNTVKGRMEKYQVWDVIGRGAFGRVFSASRIGDEAK